MLARRLATSLALFSSFFACSAPPDGGGGWNGSSDGGKSSGTDAGASGDDSAASGEDAGGGGSSVDAGGCTLPSGPYGIGQGTVLDPSHSWQGYAPGASSVSTIRLTDFMDCSGTRGVKALVIDTSAVWCGPCNQVADTLEQQVMPGPSGWTAHGVKVLTLIVQNASGGPATTSDALAWINNHNLKNEWVAADPKLSFLEAGAHQIPRLQLVDPKTLKVIDEIAGLQQSFIDEVNQFATSH